MISGCVLPSSPVSKTSIFASGSQFHAKPRLPSFKCSWQPKQELKLPLLSSRVVAGNLLLYAASNSFSSGDLDGLLQMIPNVPRRRNISMSPKASKDVPYSFSYLAMTKKPKWWWRSLACLPYLMPLHKTFMYVETTYHLHPFLEYFENPFLGAIGRLPGWFFMVYFFVAYLGIVRKKEWPNYFRFHVVMGMLLKNVLQVIGIVSHWMPWGILG